MSTLIQDLRYAARMLAKNPGFTAVAVLTLALGIGVNTTIFSIVNVVMLRPLPYPDPNRLVLVWETNVHSPEDLNITSWPNYRDWRAQNRVFESMAMFDSAGRGYNFSGTAEPEQISGVRVTASFFDVLGVKPLYGRAFTKEEETPGKDRVVVLSHGLWKRRFGGDVGIIGRTVRMDSEEFTVLGVMPPDFRFQFWSGERQLWVPIGLTEGDQQRGSHSFCTIARLKPAVSVPQARAEMDTIGRRHSNEYPKDNADKTATVTAMSDYGLRDHWQILRALLVAVAFVLLIACVNVANLMLARGATRQRELAIRTALGAHRWRIVRQMLTESLLLAVLGGGLGLLIASWGTSLLAFGLPNYLRYVPFRPLDAIGVDSRVLLFTLGASLLTGILFGIAPALSAFRTRINDPLQGESRSSTSAAGHRVRQILVAGEVALALVILAGAGLMIESTSRLLNVPPGFDPKNLLVMEMSLPQVNLYYGPPTHARFCQDLDEHVGSLAGVVSVGAVSNLPMTGGAGRGFSIEGRPDPGTKLQPGAGYNVACPNYLRTMNIPLIAGREFTHLDTVSAERVIVINESMARVYWPHENAVGKRIKLGYADSKEPWLTVVGVYGNVKHWGLDQQPPIEFMRPYTQAAWPYMSIAVRTAAAPLSYQRAVVKAIAEFEPEQPVNSVETMENVIRDSVSVNTRRFATQLLGGFSLLALLLAAVGISGVVSYSVTQRTREIGIRMALGAQGRDVLNTMMSHTMRWGLIGVAVGIIGAFGVTQLMTKMLFNVEPGDPIVLAAVAAMLTAVALVACYIPARRAARVDPMVALRYE